MNSLFRALAVVTVGIMLIGCEVREATFSRYVFVNSLYLYVEDDQWQVTVEFARPVAESGEAPKAGAVGAVGVLTAAGREPSEALFNLQRAAGKRIFLGKLEAVIMRTADLHRLREWFDVLLADTEVRGNIPVFAMDDLSRSQIVQASNQIPEPSRQLRNLTRDAGLGDIVRQTFIYRISMDLRQPWQSLIIPSIRVSPNGEADNLPFHTDGLRVLNSNRQVSIDTKDEPLVFLARGLRYTGPLTVELDSGESRTFELEDNQRKVSVSWRAGKPEIDARLILTVAPHSHLHDPGGGRLNEITQEVAEALQDALREMTADAQNRWEIDLFNLGEEVRKRSQPAQWQAKPWNDLWPTVQVNWQVQLNITNLTGPVGP